MAAYPKPLVKAGSRLRRERNRIVRAMRKPKEFALKFGQRMLNLAGGTSLAVVVIGGVGSATLAAAHPAAAAAVLAQISSLVNCSTTSPAACVAGANASSGPGVSGTSVNGVGTYGKAGSRYGVQGESAANYGVKGTSTSGGAGTAGYMANGTGVYGFTAGSGYGVIGYTPHGEGVNGTTSGDGYGVVGGSVSGIGLYGYSSSGTASYATSSSGDGVNTFSSTGAAVRATSTSGSAIVAKNASGLTVLATNASGNGGDFRGSYIGVLGRTTSTGGFPIVATDGSGNNLFYVDGAGNVSYKGGLFSFGHTTAGATTTSFSAKTTTPTLEETGTAQLAAGAATVRLEPTFAASIDPRAVYRVFITPNGDSHGLYVALKSAAGFVVRESQAGRSSVTFDYRIVATALGEAGQRMAVVNAAANAAPRAPLTAAPNQPALQRPLIPAPLPIP